MNCRVCDKQRLEPVINLGQQPWCNHFLRAEEIGSEPFYPLNVLYCLDCQTSQLDFTVKKEVMFGNHTYLSGVTSSLSEHFRQIAQEVDSRFFDGLNRKSMLDIGSNDGTQLKHFKDLGYDILGVESSETTAQIANERGLTTLNAFFNEAALDSIDKSFDVINAAGVFFHLEELHSVCRAIKKGLKKNGVFVVQFLYMKSIMENMAFDQIYHEHLLYYNLRTIEVLLNKHGLALFDAYLSPIHGGSIIGFVSHSGMKDSSDRLQELRKEEDNSNCNTIGAYQTFSQKIKTMKQENLAFLFEAKESGKRVFGLGAPVKGNTLLNYFEVGPDLVEFLVEKNPLRKGLFSPGMHIPLIMEDEVREQPNIYYVLAWNFKKEILRNNQKLIEQGVEFYFPVNPRLSA